MKRLLSVFLCVGLLFGLCSVGAVADAAPLEAEEELFQRFADEASLLRLFGAFADEGEHYSLDAVTSYVELKADFSPYGKGEDYGYVYEYYEVPAAIYESTVGSFFQLNDQLIASLRAYEGGLWNSETQTMAPLYDEEIGCYVFHGKGGLGDSTRYRTYAYHKDGEAENRYVVYFHELEPGYSPEWDDVCGKDFLLDFADDGEIYCYEITGLAKFVMEYDGTDVKFISSQPIETMPTPADWAVQESVEGFIAGPMLFGKVDGGKALWVCCFRDEPTSFEVPAEVYGLPVTGLSGQLFANPENLKSITLPEGLTRIGADAFYYCENLTEIHLPDSLETIGSWAFAATGITEVTIPAGVTEIGEYAFGNTLTDIQVAAGNTAFAVENGVLYTADKSRILFGIPGKVGEGYNIPAGVTAIDRAAFSEVTGLGEITIPDSVTQMGEWAFALSDLTAVTLSKGLKTVPYAAFVGCADLRQATIPEGVEVIDAMAFCETALEEISLPSTLRRIEDNAFAGTLLTEVVLPEGVEYIGDEVFFGCENLERLVLPASLKTVVWYNRGETGALKEIRFMGTKAQWEEVTVLGDRELLESLMVFSDVLLGDVDGDGAITTTDARLVLQFYCGKIIMDPPVSSSGLDFSTFAITADVDRDGALTTTDARLILQYAIGKITEWPNPFTIVGVGEKGQILSVEDTADGPAVSGHVLHQLCVYEHGKPTKRAVTWTSADPEGITIDADGYLTHYEFGKRVLVTATLDDGETLSLLVYTHGLGLLPDPPQMVVVTDYGNGVMHYTVCNDALDITLADTTTLQLAIDAYAGEVTWSSTMPDVATVDGNGLVTLHAAGGTRIYAQYGEGEYLEVHLRIS